jgi:hypothetical protein
MRYLVLTLYFGLWYPKGAHFEVIGYSDADYAGCKVDRKSTSGTCQFIGRSLVCWFSKKQNSITISTVETEYVAAGSYCAQLLTIVIYLLIEHILFRSSSLGLSLVVLILLESVLATL